MFWLDDIRAKLSAQLASDALSHAVLIAGSQGLGKRQLAGWLVNCYLGEPADQVAQLVQLNERLADFRHITIPEDKKQISVDQVRELSVALTLSSHGGGGKAAVIEPANTMTIAAANSLLKTLEEPPGDTLLILIADDVSRLPATVVSRSSVYALKTPDQAASAQWLADSGYDAADAREALAFANGAPLKAQHLLESGALAGLQGIANEVCALMDGSEGAMATSSRWRKLDFALVLDALYFVTQSVIYDSVAPEVRSGSDFSRYVIDTRDAFCYLDTLQRVARRGAVAINTDMALDALALPWTQRLQGCFDGRATRDV